MLQMNAKFRQDDVNEHDDAAENLPEYSGVDDAENDDMVSQLLAQYIICDQHLYTPDPTIIAACMLGPH